MNLRARLLHAWPELFLVIAIVFLTGVLLGVPAHAADASGSLDVGPALRDLIEYAFLGLYALIGWLIRKSVKDKALADIFMASLDKAADFGVRAVDNMVDDRTIPVGNERLRKALGYALQHFPKLANQMGYDKAGVAQMLWARLPVVNEGEPDFQALVDAWERKGLLK